MPVADVLLDHIHLTTGAAGIFLGTVQVASVVWLAMEAKVSRPREIAEAT